MKNDDFKNALKSVCDSLLSLADEERRKSEPYAKMFEASEHGIRGLLDEANNEMTRIILNVCSVLEERTGKPVSNEVFAMLQCLPLCRDAVEEHIRNVDGYCCCVDKARELFSGFTYRELSKRVPTAPTVPSGRPLE